MRPKVKEGLETEAAGSEEAEAAEGGLRSKVDAAATDKEAAAARVVAPGGINSRRI